MNPEDQYRRRYIESLNQEILTLKTRLDQANSQLLSYAGAETALDCAAAQTVAKLKDAEIERLKAGKFTPEEFHNLCHEDKPVTSVAFAEGCMRYQEQLFGFSSTRELIRILRERNEKFHAVLDEIHIQACLAECLHCEPAFSSIAEKAAKLIYIPSEE